MGSYYLAYSVPIGKILSTIGNGDSLPLWYPYLFLVSTLRVRLYISFIVQFFQCIPFIVTLACSAFSVRLLFLPLQHYICKLSLDFYLPPRFYLFVPTDTSQYRFHRLPSSYCARFPPCATYCLAMCITFAPNVMLPIKSIWTKILFIGSM